jgi:hypothetical protein
MTDSLPRPLLPFISFTTLLRANGFTVAPEQTQSFVAAVGLLGPRSMEDIHRAALATIGPAPERREEFDAIFRLVFLGQTVAASTTSEMDDEEELEAFDDRDGGQEPPRRTKWKSPAVLRQVRSVCSHGSSAAFPRARRFAAFAVKRPTPFRGASRDGLRRPRGAAGSICDARCARRCGATASWSACRCSSAGTGAGESSC